MEDTKLLVESANDITFNESNIKTGRSRFSFSFFSLKTSLVFVLLLVVLGGVSVLSFIYANNNWEKLKVRDWVCMFFTFAPLIALEFILGVESLRDDIKLFFSQFRLPTLPISVFLSALFVISGLFYGRFPVFSLLSVFCISVCTVATNYMIQKYKIIRRDSFLIQGLIVLLLGLMADFRWSESLYVGPKGYGYDWWALFITILGVVGWLHFDNLTNFNYRFWPIHLREIVVGVLGPLPLIILIVPLGILSGFLDFPPTEIPTILQPPTFFVENFTTVAITEELFFRSILMNTVDEIVPSKRGWFGVLIANIAFGIWHFPRRSSIADQALYGSFAFIAGCVYSIVYKLGCNNLLGSSITHSLVDTVWVFVLS